ncbi:TonB-dependent receptor, partial [Acidobacteria bacterium AH-259-A15]|nr:TonB-dependent receptor [Acidobacteria bacterium AH-259-A15]
MISTIRKSQYPTSVTGISKPAVIALAATVLLMAGSLMAQDLSGRIAGTVTDEQGAFMPGAEVTATHVATNYIYRAVTSDTGRFTIPKARLGRYTVAAEMPGFRRAVVQDVIVEVGGTATLRITLQVGEIQEEITVTAETTQELVNTVDTELGAVVDDRRVLELPLNGRNASHLVLLQAGVYFERNADGMGNKLFVHGQRHRSLNITLDGVDTQDNFNRASSIMLDQPLLALAAENVEEFRVVTGLSSAEYSRGGAQMAAVTRAGSNDFHGSVFWFHRNTVLNSNDFFNNSAAVERPPLLRHQFGARIGGPIISDKTFFFFGYQQTRQSRGIAVNRTVYTAEARQGIFRYLDNLRTTPENVAANPGLTRSVNLMECGSAIQGALGRDCVDSRFDSANPATLDPFIGNEIFGLIPLPNNSDLGDGLNTGGFRFNSPSNTVEHLPSFRLDHHFSDEHLFYGTFNYIDREIRGDFINGREPPYPGQEPLGNRVTHSRGFSAGLTSTLTPTFINEFRAGGLVHGENAFLINQPFDTPFTLDLNTITDPYDPSNNDEVRDNDTYNIRNSIAWVRGNHQIKAGAEWRHRWVHTYSFDEVNPFGEIDLDDNDFPPGFSESNLRKLSGGKDIESQDYEVARDLMNNLVGAVSEVEMRYNVRDLTSGFVLGQPERRKYQSREFDVFFNDTWAFRPNLTLNFGLRWEYATVPYETQGLALMPEGGLNAVFGISGPEGFFNPGTFAGTPCAFLGTLPTEVTSANARALITSCATQFVPGTSSNNRPLWDDDLNNFGPVIGLAWDPWGDGKTSVRAGFRISYMQDHFNIIDGNLDDNEGLRVDQDCIPDDGECINNPLFLRDVLSTGPPIAPIPDFTLPASRSILDSSTNDFRTYSTNLATPYYEEWTLSIQREVLPNMALDVRYVGNRGVKLRRVADFNEINIFARDSVTGMTFLESFIIAQQNLGCNRAEGKGSRFDDATGASCLI